MPKEKIAESERFITEVCWLYYINEMTQSEIASALGVTRLRVNAAIQKAKQDGIVKFKIESPFLPTFELREALIKRFGLKEAVVALADPSIHDYHRPVGAALADYLVNQIQTRSWKKIGVSWGRTLQSAISHMTKQDVPDLEVISIIGGTMQGADFNSFGIASGFAERLGAKYFLLAAPVFLAEGVDRDAFLSQKIFQDHINKLNNLDAAIITASNVSEKSFLVTSGLPDGTTAEDLIGAGAVGDVVGRFLDAEGKLVSNDLNGKTIGIRLDTLAETPERILVAAGRHKVEIIRAAIQRGLVNCLITDDITARLLLDSD